nr:cobalt ECF transporter T component CbiQ [Tissierella sp.]
MLIIDRYAYTNKLTNSNPYIKSALVVVSLALTTIGANNWMNLTIFFLMGFLTTYVAGIPLRKYIKILRLPMSFLLISIFTILISFSTVDIYVSSIKIFNIYIGIAESSLDQSILLTTRVLGSISATFFLGLTTPLNNIILVLKKIRLPNTFIELIVLIYRFIFIFLEEVSEIRMGQEIKFGYSDFSKSLKSTSLLLSSLFLRVMLRHKEMVIALECKLYDGEFKIGD